MLQETEITVSFGDCDPANITFYPNYFRWFDALFHLWLQQFGGHQMLCEALKAKGIGLMDVEAKFLRPVSCGDRLQLKLSVEKWGGKTLHLRYEGFVSDRLCVTGHEKRGLFRMRDGAMFAADMQQLYELVTNGETP